MISACCKEACLLQAIAMLLSDGRLALVSCLEEDDWEATVETLAAAHQPADAGSPPAADASMLPVGCVSLPDGVDLQGSRCARQLSTLHLLDQSGRRALCAICCICSSLAAGLWFGHQMRRFWWLHARQTCRQAVQSRMC